MIKKLTALFLAVLLCISLIGCGSTVEDEADTTAETTGESSDKLPDFKVYDMDGNAVTLYESFGKPLVVNFWATWCPPCKAEMPYFDELYKEYGDRVDFMMVNLTDGQRDTTASVKAFIGSNKYSFPVYCDSEMSAAIAYGVNSIPMTLFIDSEGELINYKVGAISESALESMLLKMTEEAK